jgi:hypothetical protein
MKPHVNGSPHIPTSSKIHFPCESTCSYPLLASIIDEPGSAARAASERLGQTTTKPLSQTSWGTEYKMAKI